MTRDLPDDWRLSAACGGMADDTFAVETNDPFYTPGNMGRPAKNAPRVDPYAEARAICERCPVVEACLNDSYAARDFHGFRGGLTGDQRLTLFRKHQRKGAPLPTQYIDNPKPTRKPYARTKPKPPAPDWTARERCYQAGRTDKQIAELTGTTQSAIRRWRHRRGYPPNKATA